MFLYHDAIWSNEETFNLDGRKTGFDTQETKLPSYWNTSFSKICLGMKINDNQPKFIVINKQANSLYPLIADGQYRITSLGHNKWNRWLVLRPPCRKTVTGKGSMLLVVILTTLKQESVSLVTTKIIARPVTLELGLALEELLIKATHVETRLQSFQIKAKSILRQWDIFWCCKKKLIWVYLPWCQTKASLTKL